MQKNNAALFFKFGDLKEYSNQYKFMEEIKLFEHLVITGKTIFVPPNDCLIWSRKNASAHIYGMIHRFKICDNEWINCDEIEPLSTLDKNITIILVPDNEGVPCEVVFIQICTGTEYKTTCKIIKYMMCANTAIYCIDKQPYVIPS